MESLTLVIIVGIAIWYLGSSINAILGKAGKLSEKEFKVFELNQALRHKKMVEDIKVKVKDLDKEVMSDEELHTILGV